MMTHFLARLSLSAILVASLTGLMGAPAVSEIDEVRQFQFKAPDDGIPGNTTGGASRRSDSCRIQSSEVSTSSITFLTPQSFVGLTVAERPEFLIYANRTPVDQVFISIQDENGESAYQDFHTLPTDTGLIGIEVPESVPALELGVTYRVSLVPMCEASLQPDDPILTGYVRRVSSEVSSFAMTELPYELVSQYAQSGIWYDSLSLLMTALSDEPTNDELYFAWSRLLSSGGFSEELSDDMDL